MASVNTWVLSENLHATFATWLMKLQLTCKWRHCTNGCCSLAQLLAENQVSLACKQGALWINDCILPLFLPRQDDCTEKRSRVAFFLLLVFSLALLLYFCTINFYPRWMLFLSSCLSFKRRSGERNAAHAFSLTRPEFNYRSIFPLFNNPPFCSYTVTTYVSITLQLYTTYLCEFVK